jgi:hypothetical protein
MGVEVNQTESTRNQSRATYEQKVVFLFDNRFQEEVCWNEEVSPGGSSGVIMTRINEGATGSVEPLVSDFEGLDSEAVGRIVGISATDFEGQSQPINICTKGTVSSNHLLIKTATGNKFEPADVERVNLATGLRLRDVLEKLGLHLQSSVEHTKFDN